MPLSPLHTLHSLQVVRAEGSISRAHLAEKTGHSPFLISKICDKLLAAGFVSEAGQGDSTGGRRPTLLSLKPGLGRLLGIHLGTVNVRIAMTDFRGELIEYAKAESHCNLGPEVAMQHLIDLVDQMLKKTGVSYSELDGIGIGASGVVERNTGTTLFWPKLPLWINVPVRKIFEERYKTVVEVEDTSRTQAFAEYRLGGVDSAKHFVYVAVGAGIGAALFFNGQLYSGGAGFAGEFGHMSISETGPLCSCGNRGCLETIVSAAALIRKARHGISGGLSNALMKMSLGNSANLSVEMLAQAARDGDRFSLRLLAETGTQLGRGLVGLINLLNPELIVIGGGVASAIGELILPEIERTVRERAMIQGGDKQVRIQISKLQERDWAVGATLLVVERALAKSFTEKTEPKKRAAS
ncbi:MAG: ROK family protein [Acidobacteria bacterium]|nr:ROK family protein [Acidobacteriota bacterium]